MLFAKIESAEGYNPSISDRESHCSRVARTANGFGVCWALNGGWYLSMHRMVVKEGPLLGLKALFVRNEVCLHRQL